MEKDLIKTHQKRLYDLGWYSAAIDGVAGVLTEQAMVAFKSAIGFIGRPYPGPLTLKRLWADGAPEAPKVSPTSAAPLLDIIKRYDGLREISGPRTNSTIRQWLIELGLPWRDDETAWCGTTIGGVVLEYFRSIGITNYRFGFNVAGAQQWKKFGVSTAPVPGAIAPMWRGSRHSWKGHVIIIDSVVKNASGTITHIDGWGGNQRNAINKRRFPIDRFKLSDGEFHFRLPPQLAGKGEILIASADVQMTNGNEA